MNFTLPDISNSFLNMVQPELPKNTMFDADKAGLQNQVFAKKLDKILENSKPLENNALVESTPQKQDDAASFLSDMLADKKGIEFLSELKKIFLMLSNGDLKNFSIDAKGLEDLKKLLSMAGFDTDELDQLLASLTEDMEENKLTLDELFAQLFDIPVDNTVEVADQNEQYIETSALPFLESIFNALDIPKEKVQQILSAADKGEKGISLDVVIEKLQEVQKKAFYNNTQYQTKDGDDQTKLLLKQLGFENKAFENTSLTLNELVESFEKMRKIMAQQSMTQKVSLPETTAPAMAGEKTAELVKGLLKGLEIQNMPKEKQGFEFSFDQIKNQFENDLLIPENGKTDKKGLFSALEDKKAAKDQLIKDGIKQMTSAIGEKTSKESILDTEEFVKHVKNKTAGLTDQSQVSVSDAKLSDTQANRVISESKASFKNLPSFVNQQVNKSIVRAINQGESTLRIHLKPAELGRLMLTIDNTGGTMKVNVVTENITAREILVSNSSDLKVMLSNSGVNLERFEVDMSSDFRQSMADAQNQSKNFNKKRQNRDGQTLESVTGEMMNEFDSLEDALDQGKSLHFVA